MNDKRSRASFSGHHPDFASGMPDSLQSIQPIQSSFNEAGDPLLKKQREALQLTEAQRREEAASGSQMVKRQKPFPELKPKHELEPIRHTHNQNLLRDHREAVFQHLKTQAENYPIGEQAQSPAREPSR